MTEPNPHTGNKRAKWFVLSVVFFDMLGIGIAFPVVPILLGDYTTTPEAQTYWFMVLGAGYGLMQFLCAPLLGAISDRFGRRPVLLAALVGLGFHYILIATATFVWMLLVARLIGGITGASYSVANAYLADISSPEDRAKNFGLVGAAFGLGFICGPALGGFLGDFNLHLPFYVAAVLSLANAVYGYFVVPESLPPANRSAFSLARANPFSALFNLIRQKEIGSLVIAFSLFTMAHMAMIQTWVLYTHFRFGWGTGENGILLGCVGILSVVVQGGLMGRLVKRFGEERLALTAVGVNIFVQLGYGISQVGWLMYVILFMGFLIFTAGPSVQAVVSKLSDPSKQGLTMGSLQAVNSLSMVIGPLVGNAILAQVAHLPPTDIRMGASFFFNAALNLTAFLLLWWRLSKARASAT
jgi:DHA1 family tetracycline resistance protein-like MFS transporter